MGRFAEVRLARSSDRDEIARMHALLWPETSMEEHGREIDDVMASGMIGTLPGAILISEDGAGGLAGFLSVDLRSHADGCDVARPVGFVEGWFVHERFRHRGAGQALMQAAEAWARKQGCVEMASDTWVDDEGSIKAHQNLGFEIVDVCVHFRKAL